MFFVWRRALSLLYVVKGVQLGDNTIQCCASIKVKKDYATYSYTYRYRRVRKSHHLHSSQCNDITTSFVNCGQAAILSFEDTICITACVCVC